MSSNVRTLPKHIRIPTSRRHKRKALLCVITRSTSTRYLFRAFHCLHDAGRTLLHSIVLDSTTCSTPSSLPWSRYSLQLHLSGRRRQLVQTAKDLTINMTTTYRIVTLSILPQGTRFNTTSILRGRSSMSRSLIWAIVQPLR